MAMALRKEEMESIGEFVQSHLPEWLPDRYPFELGERIVRVEEELKNQRELMKQGFLQMDKRFEMLQESMKKQFEQVDKHFEQVQASIEHMQTKMFHFMIWSFGFTVTIASLIIGIIKFT